MRRGSETPGQFPLPPASLWQLLSCMESLPSKRTCKQLGSFKGIFKGGLQEVLRGTLTGFKTRLETFDPSLHPLPHDRRRPSGPP